MPRYEVRSASSGALGDYIVWDTDTNKVVPRSDGKGVIYYGKDAKKFADTRCYNLNAGINYDGKWKKGGRGRPPKVVEDKNTTPAKATAAPIDQDELEKMLKKLVDEHFETAKQSGILDAHDAINNFLSTAAKRELESKADAISHDFNKKIEAEGQRIAAMIEEVAANKPKVFKVQSDRATTTLSEMTHEKFEALLKTILAGLHPMLVGPAASGKTTAAEQVAKAVGLDFYAMSVGSQSTKSDFLGFYNASGVYVTTMFRKAYEEGGLFLCDEIDAGNANVLVVLNAALSGQFCAFPDGMVERHKDFFFVGTANTYGTGASRQYVGRNQLDAATLDRFTTLNWPIDVRLEAHTVAHLEHGARWHKAVLAARETAERNAYRVVVSPRATMKGAHLFDQGFNVEEVIDMTILATASVDQAPILKSAAMTAWGLD
jgi:MoxR-like ATPase